MEHPHNTQRHTNQTHRTTNIHKTQTNKIGCKTTIHTNNTTNTHTGVLTLPPHRRGKLDKKQHTTNQTGNPNNNKRTKTPTTNIDGNNPPNKPATYQSQKQ